jgi:hypothetical protein
MKLTPQTKYTVSEVRSRIRVQPLPHGRGSDSSLQCPGQSRDRKGAVAEYVTVIPKGNTKLKAKRVDELRAEYRFDYAKSKPNRFAERTHRGAVNPTET